ncbi:DUF6351 family protein [Nonomuraea rosea]
MDAWITGVNADTSGRSLRNKVLRHKPADLTDACWTPETPQRKISQALSADNPGECGALFPAFATPRLVAGAPLADNVVKCRLKHPDSKDYDVEFTPAELTRLRNVFPDGVCDWSATGVEQRPLRGAWLAFD